MAADKLCNLSKTSPLLLQIPRMRDLQRIELGLAAEPPALSPSPFPALLRPRQDECPVELGERRQHGEHRSGLRRVGVGPRLGQRLERGTPRLDVMYNIEQIARRPRQAVDPDHREHVAPVKRSDDPRQLWPVGPTAAITSVELRRYRPET